MSETILAKLRHEHQEIKNLMTLVQECEDAECRLGRFEQMKEILVPHMEGEEKTFYAELRDGTDAEVAHELATEADQEHHELKEYLQRLNLLDAETDEWLKEFHSFQEHVVQHILEEESEIFEEAKEDFTREELEQIGVEFEEVKLHSNLS